MDVPVKYIKKEIVYASASFFQSHEIFKDNFFSNSPPGVFIGSKLKYPQMNIGILAPPEKVENAWLYNAQEFWAANNFNINHILRLRGNLVNSRFESSAYQAKQQSRFAGLAQDIGMAKKPVDVEIYLKKKVKLQLNPDAVTLPMGPRAPLKNAILASNPMVETRVDKVMSDTDLKAADAVNYLYNHTFPEHALSQLLSIGVLGLKKNRKFVSTKWSITAVDDIIGKKLLEDIREYPVMNEYQLFLGHYVGNYYLILMFPEVFSYELFEMYLPGSAWNSAAAVHASTDYEDYEGRKDYASNCVGGYYAARLPIAHYLHAMKRQAAVLVIRFETPEYWIGLGVFVVREASRKAINSHPIIFDTKEAMLTYVKQYIKEKFKFDVDNILQKSILLNAIKTQTKLSKFF